MSKSSPENYQWIILFWPEGLRAGLAPCVYGQFETHQSASEYRSELTTACRKEGRDPFSIVTLLLPPQVLAKEPL